MTISTSPEDEAYASFFDSIINEEAFLLNELDNHALCAVPHSSMPTSSVSNHPFSTQFLPLTPPLTSTPPFSPCHSISSANSLSPSLTTTTSPSTSTYLSPPLYTLPFSFSPSKSNDPFSDLFLHSNSSSMSPLEFRFPPSSDFSTDSDAYPITDDISPLSFTSSSFSSLPSPPLTLSSLLLPGDKPLESLCTYDVPNKEEPKRKRQKHSSSLPSESTFKSDPQDPELASATSSIAISATSTLQKRRGNFTKQKELEKILKTELEVELPKNIPKSKFPPELKKQIRMIKNRLAASESRQRAKNQLKYYQRVSCNLAQENKRLQQALDQCQQEKEELQKTLQEFSASLDLLHTAHVAPLLGPRTTLRSFGALVVCLFCVLLWLPSSFISSALYPGLDPTVPNGVYSTDVAPWNAKELELALSMHLLKLPPSTHEGSPLALPPSASSLQEGRSLRLTIERRLQT